MQLRSCFRPPIPELLEAAELLDQAVAAHSAGDRATAADLIARTNLPAIREWTESLWGAKSPYVLPRAVPNAPPSTRPTGAVRMPTSAEKCALIERDGNHCRFCGLPLIRSEIRRRIGKLYPEALPWGTRNPDQHAAFQAMWLQYDHILPHARGGDNSLDNLVLTCAPCNFGRMSYTLEEVGLADPRQRAPVRSAWDGLERFAAA